MFNEKRCSQDVEAFARCTEFREQNNVDECIKEFTLLDKSRDQLVQSRCVSLSKYSLVKVIEFRCYRLTFVKEQFSHAPSGAMGLGHLRRQGTHGPIRHPEQETLNGLPQVTTLENSDWEDQGDLYFKMFKEDVEALEGHVLYNTLHGQDGITRPKILRPRILKGSKEKPTQLKGFYHLGSHVCDGSYIDLVPQMRCTLTHSCSEDLFTLVYLRPWQTI